MDLNITCDRCKNQLTHVCNNDLKKAILAIYDFTPHWGMPDAVKKEGRKGGFYVKGEDDDAQFFSETFLYCLLGKDEGRTVLYLINNLVRAAGIDPDSEEFIKELNALYDARAEEKRLNAERQANYQRRRAERIAEEEAAKKAAKKELRQKMKTTKKKGK